MKIFFTGAVRAGRSHQPEYSEIVTQLQTFAEVLSAHVSEDTLSQFGETHLDGNQIREREIKALETCDLVVAEVTVPSLGVGYLIRHATLNNKMVLALYKDSSSFRLSEIIKGDPLVTVQIYERASEVKQMINELIN